MIGFLNNQNNNKVKIKKKKKGNGSWNSGLKVVDEIEVVIPERVGAIVSSVAAKVDTEFSILFKFHFEGGRIIVEDEYVIPKQECTAASVDFKEGLESYVQQGYRCIMHRHPDGLTSFSNDDERTINSNFDVSLLYGLKGKGSSTAGTG